MSVPYLVRLEGPPSTEDERLLDEALDEYGAEFAPKDVPQTFTVMLRRADGSLAGGLIAETGWGWLYVRTLWVEEGARGRGYGRALMALAEDEARNRGCHSARLSTQSYEARPFYEHLGYEVFGELADSPVGHTKYFLKKRLIESK